MLCDTCMLSPVCCAIVLRYVMCYLYVLCCTLCDSIVMCYGCFMLCDSIVLCHVLCVCYLLHVVRSYCAMSCAICMFSATFNAKVLCFIMCYIYVCYVMR